MMDLEHEQSLQSDLAGAQCVFPTQIMGDQAEGADEEHGDGGVALSRHDCLRRDTRKELQ
jgi:hypothetical protein